MSDDIGGIWRTVGGRRIFIKDGEDLQTAMEKSGKFGKSNDDDLKNSEDKLENVRGGFWTTLEDLQSDIEDTGADVLEIDNENVTISYADEDDNYEIQATYEVNTVYRDDKPSTITLGKRKHIERL